MLSIVGTGLKPGHVTIEGLEACIKAHTVFLESYTSLFAEGNLQELEKRIKKKIVPLTRQKVEEENDFLELAKTEHVVLLVIGDPFTATTHTEVLLRALEQKIKVEVLPGISILTVSAGVSGLQSYKFGRTVSIPFWMKNFEPESFYDNVKENKERGLHTLCLLDIKTEESRFMTSVEAVEHLQKVAEKRKEDIGDWRVVALSSLSSSNQKILQGKLKDLTKAPKGVPQSLIVVGKMHAEEEKALKALSVGF